MITSKEPKKETFNLSKLSDFNKWYERILIEAEIVDKRYPLKGMPIFTAYGFHLHSSIMQMLENEYTNLDVDKVQFPVLIPEKYLKKESQHLEGFCAEVFWVTEGGDKKLEEKAALRPTSETAMYSMFSLWIRSFRDMPLKVHQTCAVYRYETKDTLPLIRAREIHWNEMHSCHSSEAEALETLEDVWKALLYILNDCIGVFGIRLRRPEWDKFAGAQHTDILDSVLPSGKVLQSIGAHYLGQIFSKSFDISFLNENNTSEHAYMTCVGVSTRILACALSTHGDDKGLILPSTIAKYQVVIIPLVFKGKGDIVENAAKEWEKKLRRAGIRYTLDDSDKSPGEKYYFWEMKGVPLRMEIGPKDVQGNKVCLVRRENCEKVFEPSETALEKIRELLKTQDESLRAKSKAFSQSKISTAKTLEEAKKIISENGGFVKIPFYSMGKDGIEGDKIVHEVTGGEIRGFDPKETIEPGLVCAATGKPAKFWGYIAKSY